jgi:hypothetical protein
VGELDSLDLIAQTERMNAKHIISLLLILFVSFTAYADPVPSPEQTVGMFTGVGLALSCEVAAVLFLLRRHHYRIGMLGVCLFVLNVLTFFGAFETPLTRVLIDATDFPEMLCVLIIEGAIVLCEAIALFLLVRLPFIRMPESTSITIQTSILVSCVGNMTSFISGWFFIRSFMWLFWQSHGMMRGVGYFRYLMP